MVLADTDILSAIMPLLLGCQVTNVFLVQTHLIMAQGKDTHVFMGTGESLPWLVRTLEGVQGQGGLAKRHAVGITEGP